MSSLSGTSVARKTMPSSSSSSLSSGKKRAREEPSNNSKETNEKAIKTDKTKSNSSQSGGSGGSGSGWNEIDSLFSEKKKKQQDAKDEDAAAAVAAKKKKSKKPKQSTSSPSFRGNPNEKWTDDGLGGVYNADGFTGRNEDGVRVFKAHLFNKPEFGSTKDCPFDCNCCFI